MLKKWGSVRMYTDEFIDHIRTEKRYSARTQDIYEGVLKDFTDFCIGGGPSGADDGDILRFLNRTGIRNYEVSLLNGKKIGERTVNLHLSVLSSFCRYLISRDIIKSNPVRTVKRPKCGKRLPSFYREEAMKEYFDRTASVADRAALDEFAALCDRNSGAEEHNDTAAKSARRLYDERLKRLMINILYETGIRRSELIGLKIKNVDFGRKMMHIRGKGDKMREIPLISSLCEEISLYLSAAETAVGRMRLAGEPLLVTFSGKPLYPVFVDRAVKGELKDADGLTGRKSPHVLRHTLATELLNGGADLYSIKELLGHASLAATQVYTHSTVEKLKNIYSHAHPRAKRGGKNGD